MDRKYPIAAALGFALGLAALLAGCAAPAPQPFQPRGNTLVGYGYSEVKTDPLHYSVSYSDSNPKTAQSNLELRAAQLAQGAGFHYFAFDGRDSTVIKDFENDLNYDKVPQHNTAGSGNPSVIQPRDLVPTAFQEPPTNYYYAWGKVALLTDDQARANSGALAVAQVLARPAP
jgi:hypothetical protein